jgi:hypothetical protein
VAGKTDSRTVDSGLQTRGQVMPQPRVHVLDAALVALLAALAFDALSTALVWGIVRHLPF